jgi:hypothetical protein
VWPWHPICSRRVRQPPQLTLLVHPLEGTPVYTASLKVALPSCREARRHGHTAADAAADAPGLFGFINSSLGDSSEAAAVRRSGAAAEQQQPSRFGASQRLCHELSNQLKRSCSCALSSSSPESAVSRMRRCPESPPSGCRVDLVTCSCTMSTGRQYVLTMFYVTDQH